MHRPGTRITPGLRRGVRPRRDTGSTPLSPLLDRPTARWHFAFAERLRGPFDLGALRTALQTVAARQDALRYRIGDPGGAAAGPATAVALRMDDLTSLPRWQRATALDARLAAFAAAPFDPARRLWRIALYRLDTDEHVLAFAGHRAVFDPTAQARLYADLGTAYARARAGRPAELAPLRIVFADYLAWHGWQVSRRGRADLEWWRGHLHGAPTRLALPSDPSPAGRTRPPGFAASAVAGSTGFALRALSRGLGAPPAAVAFAVVGIVLGRLSGQADFLVGTPLAARRPAGFEPLVGALCDIAPIRMRPDRAASFAAQVRQARDAVRAARAHLGAGLAQIAAAMRAPATGGLVQVLFEMAEVPALALAGLSTEPVPVLVPPPVELALRCVAHPGQLRLEACYDRQRYRPERVAALLDTVRHVLSQAVTSPDRAVGEFALRPAGHVAPDHDRTVLDPLGRRAAVGELGEVAARWAGGWVGTGRQGRYAPDGTVEPADDVHTVGAT